MIIVKKIAIKMLFVIVIYIANPSISRGLTQKGSNSTPLKEHHKVYRQIQHRPFLHHLGTIG